MNRRRKIELYNASGLFLVILIIISIILVISTIPSYRKNADSGKTVINPVPDEKTSVKTAHTQKRQKETKKDHSEELKKHLTGRLTIPEKLDERVSFGGHSKKKEKRSIKKARVPLKKKSPMPELKKKPGYPKAKSIPRYVKKETELPRQEPPEMPRDLRETKMKTVTLTGSVFRLDEKGRAFCPAGSKIVLMRINGSERYETTVDKNGDYVFTGVNPSSDYILVCVSDYKYTGFVEQYNVNYPYYRPYYRPSGYYQYRRTTSGLSANVTIGESRRNPGSFRVQRANVSLNTGTYSVGYYNSPTGGSYYYSYPTYPGEVNYYEGTYLPPGGYTQWVPVQEDYNVSWHMRMSLQDAGLYKLDLTSGNADGKFVPDYRPEYDPITRQYFKFVSDVKPERVD